jgi:hypothetical protein
MRIRGGADIEDEIRFEWNPVLISETGEANANALVAL